MDFSVMSSSSDDEVSMQKPRSRFFRFVRNTLLFCLFAIILYAAAVLSMWVSWDQNNWTLFWDVTIGYLIIIPMAFLYINLYTHPPSSTLPRNHLLRVVLLNSTERIAPIDPIQPTPFAVGTGLHSEEDEHYDALASRVPTSASLGCLFALVFLLGIGPLFIHTSTDNFSGPFFLTLLVFFAPVVPLALIVFLVGWWRARRDRHTITADSQGLTWQSGRERSHKHIDWSQARAFLRSNASMLSSSSSSVATTTYMLVSSDDTFIWIIPANPKVDVLLDSDRLSRLIVTRTELPLRDITQFMREIGTTGKNLPGLVESRGLTQGVAPDVLQAAYKKSQRKVVPARLFVVLMATVVILVPFVAGGWMQWYDSSYIATFGQHLQSTTALYSDPLKEPHDAWPVASLSSDNVYSYAYVNGAYELHGSHADLSQWATLDGFTFGNAAYSVTAVERGAVPNNETDGIGLVMHANADGSDFLMFDVQYSGGWQLYHYHVYGPNDPDNWQYLYDGTSSAINQGQGATNRLTAITYNDSVYLFANGQFLKQYQPTTYDHVDLAKTGSAGVYLNTSTMTGDFTDFSVSPTPPTEFWEVVHTLNPWH